MIRAEFRRSFLSEEKLPSSARTWSVKTAFVCKDMVCQNCLRLQGHGLSKLPPSARTWSVKIRQKTWGCRRIETSKLKEWGLLWKREWKFGSHKKWGVPWLAERLSASQEGISCKESVRTWLWWRLFGEGIEWAAALVFEQWSCLSIGAMQAMQAMHQRHKSS